MKYRGMPSGRRRASASSEPLGEPLAHEAQEQVVEAAVRIHRLELARFRAVRVVAVIGDQLFERGQLGALDDVVVGARRSGIASARPGARTIDWIAFPATVTAEDQDLGLVDLRGVDELAEATPLDPCRSLTK